MIIACIICAKKFDVSADLIPKKGRLVQCNNCNHKWFFKNEVASKLKPVESKNFEIFETTNIKTDKLLFDDKGVNGKENLIINQKRTTEKNIIKDNKNKTNYKTLNLMIVFIITFIALIILIDTFKHPLSIIFPNIKILLYNLYETIKDIMLFLKDLV